jgi:hypothetical protein
MAKEDTADMAAEDTADMEDMAMVEVVFMGMVKDTGVVDMVKDTVKVTVATVWVTVDMVATDKQESAYHQEQLRTLA